jgi:hypothetical protein
MSKFTVTAFGELDADNLEEYYDVELNFNSRVIEVDISFDKKSIDRKVLEKMNQILADVQRLDQLGQNEIKRDYLSGERVKSYIDYHLNELDSIDFEILIDQAQTGSIKEEKLLDLLRLKRIGFYPDTYVRFVSLDYTLANDVTDELLVLDFTEDGHLHYITVES